MCSPIQFGNVRPRRSRNKLLWFTAITAVEREDPGRSVNYLNGVKAMVLSARRNSPSLIPVVIYLGGKRSDCFVDWLENHGAYVLVVDRLSFMQLLPDHATDHSSASMANYGAFAILDLPRFWARIWSKDFAAALTAVGADREYALFTDADMLFTADIPSTMNLAYEPQHFPPRLFLVLSDHCSDCFRVDAPLGSSPQKRLRSRRRLPSTGSVVVFTIEIRRSHAEEPGIGQ